MNPFLYGWLVMGAFTLCVDGVMSYRRVTGRCTPQAKARFDTSVAARGGIGRVMVMRACVSILAPPLALMTCVAGYINSLKDKEAG